MRAEESTTENRYGSRFAVFNECQGPVRQFTGVTGAKGEFAVCRSACLEVLMPMGRGVSGP